MITDWETNFTGLEANLQTYSFRHDEYKVQAYVETFQLEWHRLKDLHSCWTSKQVASLQIRQMVWNSRQIMARREKCGSLWKSMSIRLYLSLSLSLSLPLLLFLSLAFALCSSLLFALFCISKRQLRLWCQISCIFIGFRGILGWNLWGLDHSQLYFPDFEALEDGVCGPWTTHLRWNLWVWDHSNLPDFL